MDCCRCHPGANQPGGSGKVTAKGQFVGNFKGGEIKQLKLKIELVPNTSWYNNLRKYIDIKDWDRIRKQTYANYEHRCGICGGEGRLNCHEILDYDGKKHV